MLQQLITYELQLKELEDCGPHTSMKMKEVQLIDCEIKHTQPYFLVSNKCIIYSTKIELDCVHFTIFISLLHSTPQTPNLQSATTLVPRVAPHIQNCNKSPPRFSIPLFITNAMPLPHHLINNSIPPFFFNYYFCIF